MTLVRFVRFTCCAEMEGFLVAEMPSGTVTFLFTDIEGSTRLWEEHPEAMREALARHDEILRAAILEHGGHVLHAFIWATPNAAYTAQLVAPEIGEPDPAVFAPSTYDEALVLARSALRDLAG
jgi:class 3 adenylate cyclase